MSGPAARRTSARRRHPEDVPSRLRSEGCAARDGCVNTDIWVVRKFSSAPSLPRYRRSSDPRGRPLAHQGRDATRPRNRRDPARPRSTGLDPRHHQPDTRQGAPLGTPIWCFLESGARFAKAVCSTEPKPGPDDTRRTRPTSPMQANSMRATARSLPRRLVEARFARAPPSRASSTPDRIQNHAQHHPTRPSLPVSPQSTHRAFDQGVSRDARWVVESSSRLLRAVLLGPHSFRPTLPKLGRMPLTSGEEPK